MSKPNDKTAIECWQHINKCRSLFLSTANANGTPLASYAPFVVNGNNEFFVLLSDLAKHTTNVRTGATVSILMAADEQDCKEIFARTRAVFECVPEIIERHHPQWQEIISEFKCRFGTTVDLMTQLADFNIFKLKPVTGTYIKGFGQAYELESPKFQSATHINPGQRKRGSNS